jgi:DNA-binding transcriptional ArsR family regulator
MTPDALKRTFVGRDDLMRDVLKRIVKSATRGEKHFMLLVGPRGIGKSHFVALVHHRLTEEKEYERARKKLRVAFLNEEESIASFLDLLVRILHALTLEPDGEPLKAKVDEVFHRYAANPDDGLRFARATLTEYVGDRTLLVICENFSTILEGLEREGQQEWRAFMQEQPFWTVLATTTELTEDIQAHDAPFFGTFTIEPVEKLSFENALGLLKEKARVEGKPKIAELLDTPDGRARVRAIHHLAEGNARVYVVMSPFLNEESLKDIAPAFLDLVDEITPYYWERVGHVSPVQRKIMEFLSEKRIPTAVKDIALGCLASQQTISKQVGKLAHIGYVKSNKSGRETLYELNEPLMRICFEVKDRSSEYLKAFVDLLRGWFSQRELSERFEAAGREALSELLNKRHLETALRAGDSDGLDPFLSNLTEEATILPLGEFKQIAELGRFLTILARSGVKESPPS